MTIELPRVLRQAAGVLWPRACPGCGAFDVSVCDACLARVATVEHHRVASLPLAVAADYDAEVRRLVLSCKEAGSAAATRALGAALARVVAASPPHDVLVLVPSSVEGWVRRGFSPVRALVRAAGLHGVELMRDASGQQKRRTRAARQSSVAMHVRARDVRRLRGCSCLLLDDVVTTGATMRAAADAIAAVEGTVVGAAALAHVERRR